MYNNMLKLFNNNDNDNKILTIKIIIMIALIIYASLIVPSLPFCYLKLFDNSIIQFLLFSCIGFIAVYDIVSALLLSIVVLVILQYISVHKITNNIINKTDDILKEYPINNTLKVRSPKVRSPKVRSPKVRSPKVRSPKVKSPKVRSPKVRSPKVKSPKVKSPKVMSSKVMSPKVMSPKVMSPKIMSPKVMSPKVMSPKVMSPEILSPEIQYNNINIKHPVINNKSKIYNEVSDPYAILNNNNFNDIDDNSYYQV